MIHHNVLAVWVESRRVAIAAFAGLKLEFADVRELPAEASAAAASAKQYLTWATELLKPAAVALQTAPVRSGSQRQHVADAATKTFSGTPILRLFISSAAVYEGMGEPALSGRGEARRVAATLWPRLPGTRHPSAYEAALLGLHVQMTDLLLP
jgi:hypothetical protein